MLGNIVIGQSGGPTAVINSSVAGVYTMAKKMGVPKVYGMMHGIEGFLQGKLVDLDPYLNDGINMELLRRTPGSFLGTCRFKMPKIEENEAVYEKAIRVMEDNDIEVLFYIGGNDSMDTVKMLSDYAAAHGKKQRFIGIPKTVDNDLPVTDHCPGYGSAAKYIASSMKEIIRDNESYGAQKPTVCIVEIMGRTAGWMAAAAALSKTADCAGPDAIYLPEQTFKIDDFLNLVDELSRKKHSVVIAVSEGIRVPDGRFVCEMGANPGYIDPFGHRMLSGCADTLVTMITQNLGCKSRSVEFSTLQRSASHIASATDAEEAFRAGARAVEAAAEGRTAEMVILKRISTTPYFCDTDLYDIHEIANEEKTVPYEWITPDRRNLTDDYVQYARPLIMGEIQPFFADGMPRHLVLKELENF